jgi:uncharacterized protein YkwD
VGGVVLSALLAFAVLFATVGPLVRSADGATLDAAEWDLQTQVNSFRAARGLSTLVISDTLTAAAKWMATDMSVNDYFGHMSLDGRSPSQRMADAGYPATTTWTGEDLAAGFTAAQEVLNGWIASPAHFAVLVNPVYHAIGVGRAFGAGSRYGWYWAMDVGGVLDGGTAVTLDSGFHARWVEQSPDLALAPGQTAELVLALRNTGYRGWYAGSPGQQAYLGTAGPLDIPRTDLAFGWLSASRPATTTTSYVGPGQVGWFKFTVRAPATPGTYYLAVRGVIDGTTWLEDAGVYWTITVR